MVIRNKEERSTAIWRFVAIAAIPLLLLFLAGFSLGNTTGKEKGNLKKMLEAQTAESAACTEKTKKHEAFFGRGDAILDKIGDKVDELDKKLRDIIPLKDIHLIADWDNEVYKFFYGIDRDLAELESDWVEKNTKDSVILIGFKYLKAFKENNKLRLQTQKIMLTSTLEVDLQEKLTGLQEENKKQNEADAQKIKEERNNLAMERLQAKLDACKEELTKCQQGAGEKPDNKGKRKEIEAELGKIRSEVIPNMQTKWIGNDRDNINKLKDKLRNSVDVLEDLAKEIQ